MFVIDDPAAIVFDDHIADLFLEIDKLPADQRTALGHVLSDPNRPHGRIIAVNVSLETYDAVYAGNHCEYIEGIVIQMSPAEINHERIVYFLHRLLETYFVLRPVGRVIGQPFIMRQSKFPRRRREPDLMVLLNEHLDRLKNTQVDEGADICIEIVSDESSERDYQDKFKEYEANGIAEYWVIDPLQAEAQFHRLGEDGVYHLQTVGEAGYQTPLLPDLSVPLEWLWTPRPPNPIELVDVLRQMVGAS